MLREKVTAKTCQEQFHPCSSVNPHHSSAVRGGSFWYKKEVR